jgi:hypothetical protein
MPECRSTLATNRAADQCSAAPYRARRVVQKYDMAALRTMSTTAAELIAQEARSDAFLDLVRTHCWRARACPRKALEVSMPHFLTSHAGTRVLTCDACSGFSTPCCRLRGESARPTTARMHSARCTPCWLKRAVRLRSSAISAIWSARPWPQLARRGGRSFMAWWQGDCRARAWTQAGATAPPTPHFAPPSVRACCAPWQRRMR